MTRAVHRAGFRPLLFASRQLLLRPAALKIAAFMLLMLLALGLYSLSRGSYPLPASTLAQGPAGATGDGRAAALYSV